MSDANDDMMNEWERISTSDDDARLSMDLDVVVTEEEIKEMEERLDNLPVEDADE